MKDAEGKVWEKGASMPSPRPPLSPNLQVSTNPEALHTFSLWGFLFMEAPSLKHDYLNHWPWQLIQPPAPLSSPEIRGIGLKVSVNYSRLSLPAIRDWFPKKQQATILRRFLKVLSLRIKDTHFALNT